MIAPAGCQLIGHWPILDADMRDLDVDTLDKEYLGFHGNAELFDDGSIKIAFGCHGGAKTILKAKRDAFSTSC